MSFQFNIATTAATAATPMKKVLLNDNLENGANQIDLFLRLD